MNIAVIDSFPPELEAVADAAPRATFYHTGTWLHALAAAYPRMTLHCLVATDGNDTVGYLPFFVTRRGPFKTEWSLPFGTYGGPVGVGGDGVDRRLIDAFRERLSDRRTVESGWVDFHNALADGGHGTESETHIVDLSVGYDVLWRDGFDKPRRRRVRRAEEQGVVIRRATGDADVGRFVDVYRGRLKEWDTSEGHPETLFHDLVTRGAGGRVRLHLAVVGDDVVGGHLNFYYKEAVIAWYGMASTRGDALHAGTLLYATCMREACDGGFRSYNLGASLGKRSLIEYKQSLGGVLYRYRTVRRRRLAGNAAAWLRRLTHPR
jgi:CelD/BcsL family acetyltransferase involved in cellulose biosynthesis